MRRLDPAAAARRAGARRACRRRPARRTAAFDRLMASWFPLTYVLNNLNRGLGLPDAYPFVLSHRRSRSCASSTT